MTNDQDRYAKLQAVFRGARNLVGAERDTFLQRECGQDDTLLQEARDLLDALKTGPVVDGFSDGAIENARNQLEELIPDDVGSALLPSEQPGDPIGRYTLVREIGVGGMGSVWQAEQSEPVRRDVALKIIKLGMDTTEVVQRFEAERQALALMSHPHIAKVLDGGSTATGRPFFVMELVDGVPITEFCDRERLSLRDRLRLFVQVCGAIEHAHQKGVIHRDVKPGNVLVTRQGDVPTPHVIDFGIAKATRAELTQYTFVTEHKVLIGTPEYMAPEQADTGGQDIDTRADVYSLGVLLYELLTGTRPFELETAFAKGFSEVLRMIREDEPPRPSTRLTSLGHELAEIADARLLTEEKLRRRLLGDLDWIVLKALEKDRERRYRTASAFADDVQRYLDDEPVEARPPSQSYRLRKLVRRNRGTVAAVAALVVTLVGGLAGTGLGLYREKDANAKLDASLKEEEQQRELAVANATAAAASEARAQRELTRVTEVKNIIASMLREVKPELALTADTTLLERILANTATRLVDGEVQDEVVAAELHQIIGLTYLSLGKYAEAEEHLPRVLELLTASIGDEQAILIAKNNLAILYKRQGRRDKAIALAMETLVTQRRLLGDDHQQTVASMVNVAILLNELGRPDEAEELYLEALEAETRTLGPEHEETLTTRNNLAVVYKVQGRLDEAEAIYTDLLEIYSRTTPREHPANLAAMYSLAELRRAQGQLEEAERLFEELIELQQQVLGEEHEDTLAALSTLASIKQSTGKLEGARGLYGQVLSLQRRTLGDDHPLTVGTLLNSGFLDEKMGLLDDAYEKFSRSADDCVRLFGPLHQWTNVATTKLSQICLALGRNDEAEKHMRDQVSRLLDAVRKPDTPAGPLLTVANSLLQHPAPTLRDPKTAEELARRAVEITDRKRPDALDILARALLALGRVDDAIETLSEAIARLPADASGRAQLEARRNDLEAAREDP